MPEGSSNFTFGLSGGINATKREISFTVSTGYSSNVRENCVNVT